MLTFQLPLLFWVAILDLTWHRNYNLHFTDITSVIWRAITLDIVTFILIVIAIMIANIRSGCIGIYIFIHIRTETDIVVVVGIAFLTCDSPCTRCDVDIVIASWGGCSIALFACYFITIAIYIDSCDCTCNYNFGFLLLGVFVWKL